jgi:hypothetical protein
VVLMRINTPEAQNFWRKVGFVDVYLATDDEDEAVPPVMIKPIDPTLRIEAVPYGAFIPSPAKSAKP